MAANNSTKRKSPAPKQTKTVKQSPDQITLEETVVETPKSQKPKKNTELKVGGSKTSGGRLDDDVQKYLGLPVLGVIPEIEEG